MKQKLVLFCNEGGSQVVIAKLIWALRPNTVVSLSSREKRRFPVSFWQNMAKCSPGLVHLHVSTPPPAPGVDRPDTARRLHETLDGLPQLRMASCQVVFDITSGMGLLRELQGKAVEAWAVSLGYQFANCYCDSDGAEVSLLLNGGDGPCLKRVALRLPNREDRWLDVRMSLFSGLMTRREVEQPGSSDRVARASQGELLKELDRYRCPALRLLARRGIVATLGAALERLVAEAVEEFDGVLQDPLYLDMVRAGFVEDLSLKGSFRTALAHLEKLRERIAAGTFGQLDILEVIRGQDPLQGSTFRLDVSLLRWPMAGLYWNSQICRYFSELASRFPIHLEDRELRCERVGFEFEEAVYAELSRRMPEDVLLIRNRIISSPDGRGDRTPDAILGYPSGEVRFVEVKAYLPPLSGGAHGQEPEVPGFEDTGAVALPGDADGEKPLSTQSVMASIKGFQNNLLELFGKYKSLDDMLGGKTRTFLVVPYTAAELDEMRDATRWPELRVKLWNAMGQRLKHAEHFERTLTVVPVDRLDQILK